MKVIDTGLTEKKNLFDHSRIVRLVLLLLRSLKFSLAVNTFRCDSDVGTVAAASLPGPGVCIGFEETQLHS